jgi:hypothetical protein
VSDTLPNLRIMRSLRLIASALGISVCVTIGSYAIDTGCSCGPARGFPFSYVHPLIGCTTGRFVVGADPENRFGPVFDIGSVVYDLVIWGAVGYFVLRRLTKPRVHESAA